MYIDICIYESVVSILKYEQYKTRYFKANIYHISASSDYLLFHFNYFIPFPGRKNVPSS